MEFCVLTPEDFAAWCQALQGQNPRNKSQMHHLQQGYQYEHGIMTAHLERYRKARSAHAHYGALAAGCVCRMLRYIDLARKLEAQMAPSPSDDQLPL